jgi:hypothetical protein
MTEYVDYPLPVRELPQFLRAERDGLIAEIYAAFEGVSREGGVCWSECVVMDAYGGAEAAQAARLLETDTAWADLLFDRRWSQMDQIALWSYLDPIGYRYYLPVGMLVGLRAEYDTFNVSFCCTLTLDGDLSSRSYHFEQWSALNRRQRECVRRFLEYMEVYEAFSLYDDRNDWSLASYSYWSRMDQIDEIESR